MKIKPEQLQGQLKKSASPVYLVTGDEPLLIEESCDQIRAALLQQGFSEREVLHVDGSFNWNYLIECSQALSLFAERKLIELRLGSQKISKQSSEIIRQYLENPSPDNVLLIIADKLDGASKKSAWFKAIDKTGAIVEIWPVDIAQLPGWLKQRASAEGLQLDNDAVQLLTERLEGNLLAAKQELAKLALLYPGETLNADKVIDAVSDSSRYDIYGLSDAALQGQPQRCIKIMQVIRQEGTEAAIVLWALSREARSLMALQYGLQKGVPFDTLCQQQRIWGKRKQWAKRAAQKLPSASLQTIIEQCSEADHIIKGARQGDVWVLLSQICLRLSGHPLALQTAV